VVVTVAKGYDLGYIWKNQAQPRTGRASGGYYIDAAQAGEPPGRWWGPGAQARGFTDSQVVERQPYDAVYRQIDPRTRARFGRPRGRYPTFGDHLARLKAAEPHATAERLIELEREAAQATRQPAAYTDVTVSFSKSISVLHASIRENERRARQSGDEQAAAYWAGREQAFQEVLHRANRAALEYLQAWAGVTRVGYHGTQVDGREPGQLADPVRFTAAWERGASLRLRSGVPRARRLRPARPDPQRPARPGHGPGRPCLRGQLPGRAGRAADGRGLGPVPGPVRPDPRRPDPPRPGRQRPERTDRRGRRGLAGDLIICRRDDHTLEAGEPGHPTSPTATYCRSRPSPATASWSAACSARVRVPGSGGSPAGRSAIPGTSQPTWPTRSPGIPRKAAPCTPGSRW